MFKGTTGRTAQQIADEFESVGGYINAYTARETTAYYAKFLKEDTHMAIDILSDILQNSLISEDELERERGVVLQELYQSRDTPDDIIFEHFQKMAFGSQPLGTSILETEEIVSKMSSDDLRKYLAKYYHADNMIFGAVGNLSHNELLDIASKYFSAFSNEKTPSYNTKFKYIGGSYSDIRDIEQVHIAVGFEGVSSRDPDYYTMAIFSSVLGGGMSSRLFQEIREKRGLVYSIYSFTNSYSNNGTFGIYAATTADKLKELSDVLAVEILKMKENISEKEFNRTKAQFKASLLIAAENNSTSCEQIVNQTAIFGHPISHAEMLNKLDAVTAEDIKRLAEKVLSSKTSVVTVGKCDCSPTLSALGKHGFSC